MKLFTRALASISSVTKAFSALSDRSSKPMPSLALASKSPETSIDWTLPKAKSRRAARQLKRIRKLGLSESYKNKRRELAAEQARQRRIAASPWSGLRNKYQVTR